MSEPKPAPTVEELIGEMTEDAEALHGHSDETAGIRRHLSQRYVLLRQSLDYWDAGITQKAHLQVQNVREFFPELIFDLCTVDVFVEKALFRLTRRSRQYRRFGTFALCAMFFVLILAILYILYFSGAFGANSFSGVAKVPKEWSTIVEATLRNISVVGLGLGGVYVLTMLTRAYFHEAAILLNRDHSIPLGRLYLYLRLTAANDPEKLQLIKDNLRVDDIESIFAWNRETSTAFKDIRGESASSSFWTQLATTLQKAFSNGKS